MWGPSEHPVLATQALLPLLPSPAPKPPHLWSYVLRPYAHGPNLFYLK